MKETLTPKGKGAWIAVFLLLLLVSSAATLFVFDRLSRHENEQEQYLLRTAEQQVLVQKIARFGFAVAHGDEDSFSTLRQAQGRFTQILDELKNGNPASQLPPSPEDVVENLRLVENHWLALRDSTEEIMANQASGLTPLSNELENALSGLVDAYAMSTERLRVGTIIVGPTLAKVLCGVCIFLLIVTGWLLFSRARGQAMYASRQNQLNQEAVQRLLDEIVHLPEGDLTVKATVAENATGSLADLINQAVVKMRGLVTTINDHSNQVSRSAHITRATAQSLSETSVQQRGQLVDTSGVVRNMASTMHNMAQQANQSATVAQQSLTIAQEGGETVRQTVQSMDKIRDQVEETSKRIKRLAGSSQEINDIVGSVADIAGQANTLALNAVIQAAMAGESGRGFAVVAEGVQRLAERSTAAKKDIEALVKAIQSDGDQAVISMQAGTKEVVFSAAQAEKAAEALRRIEKVSAQMAGEIEQIAVSASKQSQAAKSVGDTMDVIQETTNQSTKSAGQALQAAEVLVKLSRQMQQTVDRFTLPLAEENADQEPS